MNRNLKTSSLFGILQNDAILGEQSLILHYTQTIGKFTHRDCLRFRGQILHVEDTDQPLATLDCLAMSKRENIGADL